MKTKMLPHQKRSKQPAADDRARRDADPGGGSPQPDGLGAFAPLGEDVDKQRERRREHERGSESHHGPGGDELRRRRRRAAPARLPEAKTASPTSSVPFRP